MGAWNTTEIKVIRLYAGLGGSALAELLERSRSSVEAKAQELGISLVVEHTDIEVDRNAARLLDLTRESVWAQICPVCGKRFVRMKSTGTCRCCHLDLLLSVHQEQLDELVRLRKLAKARQDKRRLRVCEKCGAAFFPRHTSTASTCGDCQ